MSSRSLMASTSRLTLGSGQSGSRHASRTSIVPILSQDALPPCSYPKVTRLRPMSSMPPRSFLLSSSPSSTKIRNRNSLFNLSGGSGKESLDLWSRSASTLSRRPKNPEEPEVYEEGADPTVELTDRAISHLNKVATREDNPSLALRIIVEPGGCHGYQYKMELTDEYEDDDFRFSYGDTAHLVVDSISLRLIKGSTIDYVTELIGSQFSILNNPQAKGAGCGCGVSWEPNL